MEEDEDEPSIVLSNGSRPDPRLERQLQQNVNIIYQHRLIIRAHSLIFDQVFSFFQLRELSSTTSPASSASLAVFREPTSNLFHKISEANRPIAQSLGRIFEGWTGASMEDVSLRWWGHDQDYEGEDQIVGGGGYTGLVTALRKEIEGAGGLFKLNEEVVSIKDEQGASQSGADKTPSTDPFPTR